MNVELQAVADGVILPVRVRPGSSREEIAGTHAGALRVHVHAPPEGGKANKSVVAILGKAFRLPKCDVVIVSGETASQKRVLLRGASLTACRQRIVQLLGGD